MNRLLYNKAIVDRLQELIKVYPDFRFGQLLVVCGIITYTKTGDESFTTDDPFNVESETIWNNMCNNIYCFPNE